MILSDILELFATVALGLTAVSGLILVMARIGASNMNVLYSARLAVLFQLTLIAFVLAVLPMAMLGNGIGDQQNFRISSLAMAVMIALAMLLTRRTYAKSRIEYAEKITKGKQFLFFGSLSVQAVLAAIVGAGFWDAAATVIYLAGLLVLLGLACHQLLRFVASEGFW